MKRFQIMKVGLALMAGLGIYVASGVTACVRTTQEGEQLSAKPGHSIP